MVDGEAFTGSWGRPQRDGPALRSTALITYANWLLADGNSTFVSNTLWPIIQLDLDYLTTYWNQSTYAQLAVSEHRHTHVNFFRFDLWEEVSSSSFFTSSVQHRALRQGAALATTLDKSSLSSNYTVQADNLLCFMQVSNCCVQGSESTKPSLLSSLTGTLQVHT